MACRRKCEECRRLTPVSSSPWTHHPAISSPCTARHSMRWGTNGLWRSRSYPAGRPVHRRSDDLGIKPRGPSPRVRLMASPIRALRESPGEFAAYAALIATLAAGAAALGNCNHSAALERTQAACQGGSPGMGQKVSHPGIRHRRGVWSSPAPSDCRPRLCSRPWRGNADLTS
jgi:hypothetical protein